MNSRGAPRGAPPLWPSQCEDSMDGDFEDSTEKHVRERKHTHTQEKEKKKKEREKKKLPLTPALCIIFFSKMWFLYKIIKFSFLSARTVIIELGQKKFRAFGQGFREITNKM